MVLDVCKLFPTDDDGAAAEQRRKLLGAAVRWSAKAPNSRPQGHALLHNELAYIAWDEKVSSYFLGFVPTIREIRDFYREM
eukprot:SAG31_NODE_3131_length_4641_cov_1.488771_1_plen_81_part_00